MKNKIHEMYLDYFNNFLTVDAFASYYHITNKQAQKVIELGKKINSQFDRHEYIEAQDDSGFVTCNDKGEII